MPISASRIPGPSDSPKRTPLSLRADQIPIPSKAQFAVRAKLASEWSEGVASAVFHVHSSHSDGTLRLMDIATIASRCLIDAVFMADHDYGIANDIKILEDMRSWARVLADLCSINLGVELLTDEGPHLVVYEFRRPFESIPQPGANIEMIAGWAFDNGHLIQIPHPSPRAQGMNRAEIEKVILLAREKRQKVLIAGRSAMVPGIDFSKFIPKCPEAVPIVESDAHFAQVMPIAAMHFRKSHVSSEGNVDGQKILDALVCGSEGVDFASHFAEDVLSGMGVVRSFVQRLRRKE